MKRGEREGSHDQRNLCQPQASMNRHQTQNYLFCLWPTLRNWEGLFRVTKFFTCINISDMSLNSQNLPKHLYPHTMQAEQEFSYIPYSYMCSPWTLFNKYTSNAEESLEYLGYNQQQFQRHFRTEYKFKRRCVTCRWQHLITLSRWESKSPSFYSWWWSGEEGGVGVNRG